MTSQCSQLRQGLKPALVDQKRTAHVTERATAQAMYWGVCRRGDIEISKKHAVTSDQDILDLLANAPSARRHGTKNPSSLC
mmetsp:Transcript_32819/g.94257  ORF Transcript_32819/g.94257 Transcript_32819/m.94257 type:complete len:81 (+) Transcript_32819:393-635(+)